MRANEKGTIHRLMKGGNPLLLSSIASSIAGSANIMRPSSQKQSKPSKEEKNKTTPEVESSIKTSIAAAGAIKKSTTTASTEDKKTSENKSTSSKSSLVKLKDSIQESLNKMNSCNKDDSQNTNNAFNEWLTDLFKPDPKSNDINTHLVFYTTKNPNNRGTHISDFDIIVENEEMPLTNLDRVDYFLSNYVKMIENERLSDEDPAKVDRSKFFNKIKKTFPQYSSKVVRGGKKITKRRRKRHSSTQKKK